MENYEERLKKLSECILKDGFTVTKEEKPNVKFPAFSDITYTISIRTVREVQEPVEEFINNLRDDIISQYHKEEVKNGI